MHIYKHIQIFTYFRIYILRLNVASQNVLHLWWYRYMTVMYLYHHRVYIHLYIYIYISVYMYAPIWQQLPWNRKNLRNICRNSMCVWSHVHAYMCVQICTYVYIFHQKLFCVCDHEHMDVSCSFREWDVATDECVTSHTYVYVYVYTHI